MYRPRVSLLVAGLVAGLGFAHPTMGADGDYVFILGARGNPYWTALADGIQQGSKDKGISSIVYQTDDDENAEAQLTLCQTAIQRKPKVMAMEAMTSAIGIECFKQAAAAGIIVGDIDKHLTRDEAAKAGISLAFTVGSDNTQIGHEAAKYVTSIAGKPDPKILIIEGAPGSVPGEKRADGFRDGIKELLPSAVTVASISANWDRLKAMSLTADTLQRQPDLDVIYAVNDVMALGVVEAVHDANAANVRVIGVDGTADARKAVETGRMSATVAQLPYLIGMKAVSLAYDAVHGQKPGQVEDTPTPVLTKDVLAVGKDPLLQYVR
jgi:ABC-type sugar transport system substrate-binding protein